MIIIYGKPGCGYCIRAVGLVESLVLKYEYRDISDETTKQELLTRNPNAKSVPQIWWDDRYIGGFSEFALEVENTVGGYGDGKI